MAHRGSCHCGKIAYEVEAEFNQVNECNCSHCSRKGYLLAFVPRETVTMSTPMEAMSTYRFNRHAIAHHFCPDCGCAPIAFGSTPDGKAMAAINVRCIEGIEISGLERVPVDGRSF